MERERRKEGKKEEKLLFSTAEY